MQQTATPNAVGEDIRDLRALPKAHLHAHLDGSYPKEAVELLAARHGRDFHVPQQFDDVWAFFEAYGCVPELVESHEDLASLCRALVSSESAEGVLYLEPAIEPQLYAPRLGSIRQVTTTMLAAFAEASADAPIEVGALVTINTDQDEEIADELSRTAAEFAGSGVTALGTAGFLEPGNLSRYIDAAAIGRGAGLPVVAHAGQTGGPESISEALDLLKATRISHGFRAIESDALVQRMVDEGIVCDIAPVSNVRLGVVSSIAEHPAPLLARAGVPVTLNADDALWFSTSITDQYHLARDVWGLDDRALARLAANGMRATGMSTATRNLFRHNLDTWEQS